ncbi:tudor domain-containing protein 1 isoform X2 [Tiliqua scincoides]|uniref:tudor domain-containing protein 1 isoform X2 n=1 Tax=Tiliqua scincoides TaxID=71010 RepID=UPI00346303B3
MAWRFHIKDKELRMPNESLRTPYTTPNIQNSLPEDKVSALSKNFLMCDQTKLCFVKHGGGLSEISHGCSSRQIMGSSISEDLTGHLETMNASSKSSSPASEKNCVLRSALIHGQQKKLQHSPKFALSMSYDLQSFAPLSPFHQPTCHFCGLSGSLRCTQCKQIHYCSLDCQKKDWQEHSVVCKPVKQNIDKVEDNAKPLEEIKKKVKLSANPNKTEEQGKRTMFSDLNSLGLKKDMKIEGTITVFSNPGEFYVQVDAPEVLSVISKLSVKLKDPCGLNQEEYTPAKGEVCVAKHAVDQTWYRVLITDMDVVKKTAQVLYIDYGNRGNVPLHRIKPLHKDVAPFPPCAIKCCVANIHPVKEEWDANCSSTVAALLVGKYCSLTIIDVCMGEMTFFAVDIILSDSGKHMHEILLEMGCVLDSNHKDRSATGSTMEKISVQDKTIEYKGQVHSDRLASKIISLSIRDVFWGMVAHIQSPGNFFCQRMENGKDTQWYRASLLSYTSDQTALVGYVDFGNLEILQLSRLRPITPKLMELPVQAIACILAGVKPVSETWSTEATSLMKKLVQNKVLSIEVMDKKENTFVVELTDESVTPVISASQYLLESGYAVKEASVSKVIESTIETLHEASDQKLEKVDWTWVTVTPKQVVNVVMCVLCNPSEFYCHLLNNEDLNALRELNLSLIEYCRKTAPDISKVTEGEPCCAYFSGDGKWYRALVKEATSSGTFKVQFVDYGNREEVTLDKLRQISSVFLRLPFQAVRCQLAGISPINKEWTTEASAAFQMKTAGKKLQAQVVSLTLDGAEVELIDNSTGSPVMISEILINEHMALKRVLSKQNMLPGKLATSHFQELSSHVQWTAAEVSVNETLSVRVVEVINPNLFYAVPIKAKVDPQKLHKLMIELADYCSSQNDRVFKPKVGDACCARFSGDDHWYRAVILGITVSEVKVAYADFGNVEMLPLSRLQPIPAFLLELPFQIFKCSLAGIMELDGQWHESTTEKLKNLVLNECVVITVKNISESIHAVTVNRNFENDTLNVADQLVVENLAKYSNSGPECAKKDKCCCTELRKRVAKLEHVLFLLIKEHFGEEKLNENFAIGL